MLNLNSEALQSTLDQLEQAVYHLEQWRKNLNRTLLCRLPYDLRDVSADAHRQCRFGHWYYISAMQDIRDHEAFVAVGIEHERMHRLASRLLIASAEGRSFSSADYDTFVRAVDNLLLQMYALKHEVETALHNRDPLTGAENRASMLSNLRELLELVKRRVQQCSLGIMDLDYFKAINDTYGHQTGDKVLCALVRAIREHMRLYDKIFRYGGEEFLIVMQNTDSQTALLVIERIRVMIAGTALARAGDAPIFITASFGIAPLDPEVAIEESIERADHALYAAKAAGRNRTQLWQPPENREARAEKGTLYV